MLEQSLAQGDGERNGPVETAFSVHVLPVGPLSLDGSSRQLSIVCFALTTCKIKAFVSVLASARRDGAESAYLRRSESAKAHQRRDVLLFDVGGVVRRDDALAPLSLSTVFSTRRGRRRRTITLAVAFAS